jgi:glutathione peroxidase
MKKLIYKYLLFMKNKDIRSKPLISNMAHKSFYDLKMRTGDGKEFNFSSLKGKKVLLVNTASECGYTPQYTELQQLHENKGDKLVILGFPANNFGGQEPGTDAEIGAFCQKNYGVTFQIMEKTDVVGANQNDVYKWLTHKDQNGWNEEKPSWNFCKYLVDENGELVKFFSAAVSPLSEEVLKAV